MLPRHAKLVIQYSCVCGVKRAPVAVRFRAEDEDVVFYVKEVIAFAIARDHNERSPGCRVITIAETWIPMPKDAKYAGDRNASYEPEQVKL